MLAVFMGGLAIGAVVFGRLVDRGWRPLRTYVVLELVIAGYCLFLPLLVWAAGVGYVSLAAGSFGSTGRELLLRFGLSLLVLLLPAVLMGGTLPVLARHLVGEIEETQNRVASLYALNGFGAVLGAGVAGFLTLPLLGVYGSLAGASLLNAVAAALVWELARKEQPEDEPPAQPKSEPPEFASAYRPEQYMTTLVALALSGFAAMGYEVLFSRVIALAFGGSAHSFTVMLMSFITGISLGSLIISRVRVERPLWLLGISQLAVPVALIAVTPLVSRLPYLMALMRIELGQAPAGFELYQLGKALLCLAVLLVPTTCLGFSFPLVARVQARHPGEIGTRVGNTYAWNTAGNVLGTIGTSLVLLPALGLLGAFHFNFALNIAAGLLILAVASEVPVARRIATVSVPAVVAALYLFVGGGWLDPVNLATNHLRLNSGPTASDDAETRANHPSASFEAWKRRYVASPAVDETFHFEEDAHATVLVSANAKETVLYVNTKADASTQRDLPTQLFLAHVPLLLTTNTRNLLVIGHGSGITAGSALRYPVEHADIVEISPAVMNADRLFTRFNYDVLHDPRVDVHIADALSFLRTVPRRYDVIISEPSNPWVSGIAGLFTVEFFESARRKLAPGGLFTAWFHQYEQSQESVELVLRTLGSVFPHVVVFRSPDYADLIAVASLEPIEPDFARIEQRFDTPVVRNDLARIGITNVASLLLHHAVSAEELRAALPTGPLNTERHQRLEYQAPRNLFEGKSSTFVQSLDPIYLGIGSETGVFLDRYAAYRRTHGEPIRREELEYIHRVAKPNLAAALAARWAQESIEPPVRPSRGFVVSPEEMGLYEAGLWANRYREAGQTELATRLYSRFSRLLQAQ